MSNHMAEIHMRAGARNPRILRTPRRHMADACRQAVLWLKFDRLLHSPARK
jgi:hypothetical protein